MKRFKAFLPFFSFLTPLLAVGLTQFSVLTVGVLSSGQVMAQTANCRGGNLGASYRVCMSWTGSWGQNTYDTTSDMLIDLASLQWPSDATTYPIQAPSVSLQGDEPIRGRAVTTTYRSFSVWGVPTANVVHIGNGRYRLKKPYNQNFEFEVTIGMRDGVDGNVNKIMSGTTSFDYRLDNTARNLYFVANIKPYWTNRYPNDTGSINAAGLKLFDLRLDSQTGQVLGTVAVSGRTNGGVIKPPVVKPTTCDTYAGGDFTFDFGRVSLDVFRANPEYDANKNIQKSIICPRSVPLKATFRDLASGQPANATHLKNTGTATGIDVRLYLTTPKNQTPQLVQMGEVYTIRDVVTGNTNKQTENFTLGAKLFNTTGTANNPATGTVSASGTMTLSYD